MSNLLNVKNVNFVITGGLGQIGLKLCEYLEQNGSKMAIIDLYDQKKLKIQKKTSIS